MEGRQTVPDRKRAGEDPFERQECPLGPDEAELRPGPLLLRSSTSASEMFGEWSGSPSRMVRVYSLTTFQVLIYKVDYLLFKVLTQKQQSRQL